MEKWIKRWEDHLGVAPRLTEFFASPGGRRLLENACTKREGKVNFDPEVFPFLLCLYVWTGEKWKEVPTKQDRKEAAKHFLQAINSLEKLKGDERLGNPQELQYLISGLEGLIQKLKTLSTVMDMARVGQVGVAGNPPDPRRDRVTRQIVFFLTGYFEDLDWPKPSWEIITEFLKAANLIPEKTIPKNIATWWSNLLKREVNVGNPIESHQVGLVKLFQVYKEMVHREGIGKVPINP